MSDSYYPRHGGEQGASSEELHIAWLEDRVALLEQLLRVVQYQVSAPHADKIAEALRAGKP